MVQPAAVPRTPRDLAGRTIVVTGANRGIGRVSARVLAQRGAKVFLGCRSIEVGDAAARAIRRDAASAGAEAEVEALALDLGDLQSVRRAAAELIERRVPLHGLINNAGLAGTNALSRDGFELTFAVNHLGHFLLTRLLEAPLRAGAPSRVVNVSSTAHRRVDGIDFAALRRPAPGVGGWLTRYGTSKLCNILFSRELARRWAGSGVTAYALHPGVVATDIWRRIPQPFRWLLTRRMLTSEQGARTTLYCATAPELATASGRYYDNEREATPTAAAQDDQLAARLWEESERMVGLA
jgi:retinol dehydrogenase 12